MIRILTSLICALALLAPVRTLAAREEAAAPPSSQRWKGAIELPGVVLDFSIHLSEKGGTISIPLQGVKDHPLDDAAVDGRTLKFLLIPPGVPEEAWARFEATIDDDGRAAQGTLRQAGHSFPLRMTRLADDEADPGLNRPQHPRPPFPYGEREVVFTNKADGTVIAGTLTIPTGEGPHPAVILITGSGAQDRDETIFGHKPFLVIADHLTRRGVAVLRNDDRGVGGTGGDIIAATADVLVSDVLASIDFLKSQPEIDPGRIGLIGHSEGGILAPIVASRSGDVRFIVLLAGTGLPGKDLLRFQSEAIVRIAGVADEEALEASLVRHTETMDLVLRGAPEQEIKAAIADLARLQARAAGQPQIDDASMQMLVDQQYVSITSPWFRSFIALDPREALRKVTVPVLALNGERDLQVPPRLNLPHIEAALKEAGNADVTVMELPGLNHLFQQAPTGAISEYASIEQTISPEVLELIADWVRARAALN